jgi:hypothetical protein
MAATETASSRQVWFLNTLVNSKLGLKAADWLPAIEAENGTAFFTASASWLAEQGAGKDEVSKAITFLKNKQRKSGFDGVWGILGLKGHTKVETTTKTVPAAPAAAAAVVADPKAILATAFAEGKIDLAKFMAGIAALNATVKTVEVPDIEEHELDLTGSTDGLAF